MHSRAHISMQGVRGRTPPRSRIHANTSQMICTESFVSLRDITGVAVSSCSSSPGATSASVMSFTLTSWPSRPTVVSRAAVASRSLSWPFASWSTFGCAGAGRLMVSLVFSSAAISLTSTCAFSVAVVPLIPRVALRSERVRQELYGSSFDYLLDALGIPQSRLPQEILLGTCRRPSDRTRPSSSAFAVSLCAALVARGPLHVVRRSPRLLTLV